MIRILTSSQMPIILYELSHAISYIRCDEQRKAYQKEFAEVSNDFLKIIKSKLFRDLCGEVKGIRGCFSECEVYVYQKD